MADVKSCVNGMSRKLRVGQPVPVCGCLPNIQNLQYIMQSFGAEERVVKVYRATTKILASQDFIGLNPEAEWENANYNATNYITKDGEMIMTGQERGLANYVSEQTIPGIEDFHL